MKKWARQSSIWRTDFCLATGPAVACRRPTARKSAAVGIPMSNTNSLILKRSFSFSSGINQWRDQLKPSQILQHLAKLRGVPPPRFEGDGSSLSFSGRQYNLQDFGTALIF